MKQIETKGWPMVEKQNDKATSHVHTGTPIGEDWFYTGGNTVAEVLY